MNQFKRKFVVLLVCSMALLPLRAQYAMGTTGLLNIPTADWNETAAVMVGGNFLTKEIMTENFGYNTYNYFATAQLFKFIELTFRETLLKSNYMNNHASFKEQDRSFSIRVNLLREKKWWPSIAIGAHDPWADYGNNYYECYYGVMTKGFDFGGNHLSATAGYFYGRGESPQGKAYKNRYDGPFGGVCFQPAFYRPLKIMAEYDSMGWNAGAAVTLWKHLGMHVFTREGKGVVAGLRYECVLLH